MKSSFPFLLLYNSGILFIKSKGSDIPNIHNNEFICSLLNLKLNKAKYKAIITGRKKKININIFTIVLLLSYIKSFIYYSFPIILLKIYRPVLKVVNEINITTKLSLKRTEHKIISNNATIIDITLADNIFIIVFIFHL